jgi:hypothetical protein
MASNQTEILTPEDVAREFGIPVRTQHVWHYRNAYGWADLTIKVGRNSRYRRADIEAWLTARKGV